MQLNGSDDVILNRLNIEVDFDLAWISKKSNLYMFSLMLRASHCSLGIYM